MHNCQDSLQRCICAEVLRLSISRFQSIASIDPEFVISELPPGAEVSLHCHN